MTFLELVQRLHELAGATGSPPTTVVGQIGESSRLVNWAAMADFNLQTRWLNWKFLHKQTGSNYQINKSGNTPPPSDLRTWDIDSFFIRESKRDEWSRIQTIEREIWHSEGFLPPTQEGYPMMVVINQDMSLSFDPIPDQQYPIRADYYKAPVRMAADDDVSPVPKYYHDNVILGDALMFAGYYEEAPELLAQATFLIGSYRGQLEAEQLPGQADMWKMAGGLQVAV